MVLVQEYADGGDLYHRLRAGPQQLSEQCAANAVMQPLLGALQYLHSVGIMHRDIKVSRTAASRVALWQYLPSVLLRGVTNGLPTLHKCHVSGVTSAFPPIRCRLHVSPAAPGLQLENLVLFRDGTLKLTDFGYAAAHSRVMLPA